ncbi:MULTISPECIES: SPOR domain-containing protein [unclassified Thioalkalivibrio]|uniref:SPOR domain-containing protein n=1 Tax=unclassified Thioalkalivibrio TaxID=2621013 RepID=UPI00037EB915|nr:MULTISPECIES: SPOR domain-containing protein [unclassified Thioalkalivibrio]
MALSEQCLEHLGLHAPPFDDAPDETFIYSDPLLDGLLESARAALNGPGAVVLMTGENGSGRSLQLMRLLAMLPDPFELIAFRARINTQFESVDNTIRNYLRSQNADDPDRPLTELLGDRVAEGVDPVIAMDDAHLVGTDIVNNLMRMRSEILARQGRAPRIILVGSSGLLRRRLYLPDPSDEDQVTRVSLRAFNLEQTAAYLRHRLQAAGLADPDRLLDADAIHHLQTTSQGLPGNLNREANSFLERQCRSERRTGATATAAGSTAPGVAAGEAAETDTDIEPQDGEPAITPSTREAEPVSEMPSETTIRASRDPDDDRFTPAAEALAASTPRPDPPRETAPEAPPGEPGGIDADHRIPEPPAAENVAFWNQRWFVPAVAITVALGIAAPVAWQLLETESAPTDSEIIELPLPEPRITEAEPEPAPEGPAATTDDEVVVADPLDLPPPAEAEPTERETAPQDPAADEPEPETAAEPAEQAPASEPPAEPESTPEPEPEPAPEPTPEPTPEPELATEEPAAEDADAERLRNDRAWLNDQDGGATTIQLLAAPNMGAARAYADQHDLGGIRYIPTRVNNREFVVILAGVFPDRAAAQRAAEDLPAAVRRDEPWIRSIGSVQNAVRD